MNILMIPIGSAGDVHPFVGLGLSLRARGHEVAIATNGHFEPLVRRAGLEFIELFGEKEYREAVDHPDLWHPIKGFRYMAEWMIRLLRPVYEVVETRSKPGETIVVTGALALGARVAQERLGVPLATVQLQPAVMRSVYQGPVFAHFSLAGRMPKWAKRSIYRAIDALVIDRSLREGVNAFRAELGLPPVRRIMDQWWNSPQRVIAMFPDWYAPAQPDWPPQTRLTGFPLYDESDISECPAPLTDFLGRGDPPIVFTPGSAMKRGREFFAASVDACLRLRRRGLLLTRFPEQVPERLPETICHVAYAPFSQVLPKAAALVHHGGIGTTAQALAAGIPQLVMPMAHDQPDNAARLERLGVGRTLYPKAYRGPAVAQRLGELLGSEQVARCCREVAARFEDADPLGDACRLIEELAGRSPALA